MNGVSKLGLAALCALAVASVGLAQAASGNEQDAQNAVKVRKAVFDVQNYSFAPVAAMLKGAPFNAKVVVTAAQRIEMTSQLIPEVFKFNTTSFKVNTKARDAVWKSMPDFVQKADDLTQAAQKMQAAAQSGDQSATMQAAISVGKACGSCHDEFRNKE